MQYHQFRELSLSALGLGCMRLPVVDGNNGVIDQAKLDEMVDFAMANGINYYDTAWVYHDGTSEEAIGKSLARYPRKKWHIASKLPGFDIPNIEKKDEIFETQLKRCGVEYFDFYLFHNICEADIDFYLDPKYGVLDYFFEQKRLGRIKHLGFSSHGAPETMKRFLDACKGEMEFCQIELNWLDWELQNAKAKVALLQEYKVPIWIMEPLRGGKLANLTDGYAEKLKALHPEWKIPEWSFRYLQGIEGVTVTLSGMSNMQQLQENIATFAEVAPLTEAETAVLYEIAADMMAKKTLPCTGCRYCTPHCPQSLNIPWLIELYNERLYSGDNFITEMAVDSLPEDKRPSACIGCRGCEAVCPQGIKISEMMQDFTEKLKK